MKKVFNIMVVMSFILSTLCFTIVIKNELAEDQLAYVDVNQLYESYSAKIEREAEFQYMVGKQTSILDSLETEITAKYDRYQLEPNVALENDILIMQKNYERLNEEFSAIAAEQQQRFIQELMAQINEQVQEYGTTNEFEIILGANGDGSLMYASEVKDITSDVLTFINENYEG